MKLKKIIPLLLILSAAVIGALAASPYLIRLAAVQTVQNALPGSEVTLGAGYFTGPSDLLLRDLRISFKSPSKNFPALRLPDTGKSALSLFLKTITVQNLTLDVQTLDLNMLGSFTFTRDMREAALDNVSLSIPSLSLGPFRAKDIQASSDSPGAGKFSAASLLSSKFLVENLRGTFRISDAGLLMDNMSAVFLDGALRGRLTLTRLGAAPICTAEIDLSDIPIASFLKLWEWDKKISANGSLNGHLLAEIQGGKPTKLGGAMVASSEGNLVILDQAFLENIAARSKQPIEIVRASFEDYHYNTGTVGVALEESNLRLNLDLDGEKGKRNLEVTLHDWF